MKSHLFLAGALALCLAPGAFLLAGCGGGSGSTTAALPELRFARESNLEFPDSPEIYGVLTVNFADVRPSTNARAAGTLQIFRRPDSIAIPPPFPEPPPGAGTNDYLSVLPADATYILVGNVVPTDGANADIVLDLQGSYQGKPRFTVRGDFVSEAQISLVAQFERGTSTVRGRVTNVNNPKRPTTANPTPTNTPRVNGNTTGTTTGATTVGTTTTGTTTAGATTAGATTVGATTAGATTAGATTAGATTAGSTLAGGGGTTNPPMVP